MIVLQAAAWLPFLLLPESLARSVRLHFLSEKEKGSPYLYTDDEQF